MHGHHFGRGPPPQQPPPHHDHGHHYGPQAPFSTPSNATANSQPAAEPAAEKTTSSGEGSVAAPVITPFTLQPVKVSTPGYVQSSFLKLGPCGGTGGTPFSTPLDENTKLLSVKVWEGPDGLAGIQAKYELNGEITTSPIWGTSQQDTENFNEVTFDAEQGEILISIAGTVDKSSEGDIVVVQSLSLVTNVATYGPMGNATNSTAREFSLTAGNDGHIIGFFGFSGALLESIGVLAKPAAPATEILPLPATGLALQGPSGGVGGQEFTMNMNADTKFFGIKLIINSLSTIAAIQFMYDTAEEKGRYTDLFGSNTLPGRQYLTVEFEGGAHFLTCVRGTVAITKDLRFFYQTGVLGDEGDTLAVTSLTFVTDDGKTYGPFGTEEGGVPFSYTGKIVGFHGRTSWLLYSIGVIVAPN
uniref:Jacalin-related lectin n=1 Tax=Eichhornia crassipes TaxID=44947 RepID=C7F6V9_EICCR|nr:jacalin-related lectin [Pontederia crassipes]